MPAIAVDIPTSDGVASASLHVPDGDGPWPGVIMFPDAGSLRDVFRDMAERLAATGYAVLVPDIYYRSVPYEPFSISTVFTDPDERTRLGALASLLTGPKAAADAEAFADFLASRDEVAAGPFGTTGYCMGGRLSLIAAVALGGRAGASASFHGGRLAVEDDPGSPHLLAGDIRAEVLVAAAENDHSFDEAEAARLHGALEAAGIVHQIEVYPAAHGFAVPDNPTFDEAASERHWSALAELYGRTLG